MDWEGFSLRLRVAPAPNAPKEPIAKSPAVEEGSGTGISLDALTLHFNILERLVDRDTSRKLKCV